MLNNNTIYVHLLVKVNLKIYIHLAIFNMVTLDKEIWNKWQCLHTITLLLAIKITLVAHDRFITCPISKMVNKYKIFVPDFGILCSINLRNYSRLRAQKYREIKYYSHCCLFLLAYPQSTIKKRKIHSLPEFAVTSYATVTAFYWILNIVRGEFWNNIYAKQGQFWDKIVSE